MSLLARSLPSRSLTLRHLFRSLLQPIPSPFLALSALALPSLSPTAPNSTLDRLRSLLEGWVFAVPKSKTSHSKKSMRSSNKGLKEDQAIVSCPSCGTPKRAHHLCHGCHTAYRQEFHQEAKHLALQKKLDKLSEGSAGKSLS